MNDGLIPPDEMKSPHAERGAVPLGRRGDRTSCQIATGVHIVTATHPVDPEPRRLGWEAAEPISIGGNVWLGGVVVCPGVPVGDDKVVGAGGVVTGDLLSDRIAFPLAVDP